jgi:hypothetical protein
LSHYSIYNIGNKSKQTLCSVWAEDDWVYSSPNAPRLPSIPVYLDSSYEDLHNTTVPSEVRGLQWALPAYPFLAYQSVTACFEGPCFQHMSWDKARIPIVADGFVYRLSPSVAETQQRLELALIFVTESLNTQSRFALPLDFRFFRVPESFSYMRTHKQRRFAIKCAMMSQDAFIPLMAMCSMAIANTLE